MSTAPVSTVLDALNWRYATKKFDPTKKVPPAIWAALEEALVLAPSSFGLQPWKFIVVEDVALRAKLLGASWGQAQVVDASHLVVFALRKNLDAAHVDKFLARQIAVRGGTAEALAGYRNMMLGSLDGARAKGHLDAWQSHQVYIALGQFMTAAALLGIDTCPMEGIDPAKYDELLGLTGTDCTALCACPVGYRAADDKYATLPKVRFHSTDVVVHM